MKDKAVILLSGGLDSATALFIAKEKGYECFPLIFDYGQRLRREVLSAEALSEMAGCRHTTLNIDLPWKGSSLLDRRLTVPKKINKSKIPSTYVPARNTIFLSFALSFAEAIGASYIFMGAHVEDYSGYPDCRPVYFRAFDKVKNHGTKNGKKIKIMKPLLNKSKSEIIKTGIKLGVPYELTWSCYEGADTPCGTCDSCYYREKGFREAGVEDPLIKANLKE